MKCRIYPHRFVCHLWGSALARLLLIAGSAWLGMDGRTHAGQDGTGQPSLRVVPPDELVAGKTYAEWMAFWWQWALKIPWDGHHPLQDRTGADALRGQTVPVWFLGAGPVSSSTTRRAMVVPEGQRLYVAIGNLECSTREGDPFGGTNEAELRACAERFHLQELACEIDGLPVPDLEQYQVTSPLFSFVLPGKNMLGIAGGGAGQSVGSGVGVILEPIGAGTHTLYLHSTYAEDPGASLSEMTYEITVVSRPPLSIRAVPGSNRLELSWLETAGYSLRQTDALDSSASWPAASVEASRLENGVRFVAVTRASTQRYYRLEFR